MFTLLKYWFRNDNPLPTGALPDTRTAGEKANDINFKDIVAYANPVNWTEKTTYRTFPQLDQKQSYTCGANALSKALGVAYSIKLGSYVPFSRADIYQRRMNKPEQGMAMWDMFRIASEGVTLEQLTPKPIYTDSDADTMTIEPYKHLVGNVFSVTGGVYLNPDIDTIASIIQTTGKGVILLTYFLAGEWSKSTPTIINPLLSASDALRHFVVATDFGIENGVKVLKIEDSAWFGGINERKITESWVKNRVIGAGYPMNFKFQVGTTGRPTYDGATITSAQKCLQFEGLFPINISFVENVGPTTKKALLSFQRKYNLVVTGLIDTATKNKLSTLYP